MFDMIKMDGYKIIHLTDGSLLTAAVNRIENGKADGLNLNYIKNFPANLEPLRNSKSIKWLAVNDYPPSMDYDYSAMHSLHNLSHLSIYTSDKKGIDFSAFPHLSNVALSWRPKAKSIFTSTQLQRLFLGGYTGKNLSELSVLKNLKYLRINTGSVISLAGLKSISGLEDLILMQVTKLEDIDEILELKHLKYLRIDNCKRVKNIDSIKKMRITKFEIAGTTPN